MEKPILMVETFRGGSLPPSDSRQCPFCATFFSRVDATRRHAKRCSQRKGRDLLSRQRGRHSKACNHCSRLKVHCSRRNDGACERCSSRKLSCSFGQPCVEHKERLRENLPVSCHRLDGRIPLSFLLNATDEKLELFTEKTIGQEPDRPLLGPTCRGSPESQSTGSEALDLFEYSLTSPFDLDLLLMPLDALCSTDDEGYLDIAALPPSWDVRLCTRLEVLETELTEYSKSGSPSTLFDPSPFRSFFSARNVRAFAMAFCSKRHYQYPIIHWTTFILEEAALPLLLAVSLTGAAYSLSQGKHHVVAARKFYHLADSYIFSQLEGCTLDPTNNSSDSLQLCQAGLLMYALEILPAIESSMHQIAITARLPLLISVLRRLNFTGCQHELPESDDIFLFREKVIRLVAWTYCADCLATLSCNKPPGFSIQEMTGCLPCDPAIWECDWPRKGFNSECRQSHSCSLKDLVTGLLSGNTSTVSDLDNAPIFHLHIVLCAVQHQIFNLHVSGALIEQSNKLLRGLQKWQELWQKARHALTDVDRQYIGVAKHVSDLAYLTKRIIEVAASPDAASSRYLQRIPSAGVRDLHEFIRDHASPT